MSVLMRIAARVVLVLLLAASLAPAIAAACPDCKDASSDAETPGGSANLGRGFFWSILLMLAAPFTVVGSVAVVILRKRRRQSGDHA
jgi:hypothetical protein